MTPRLPLLASAALLTVTSFAATPAQAVDLPTGFNARTIARGLVAPVDLEVAPNGRLFIAEQAGRVRIRRSNGKLVTFLRLGARVDHTDERGLSGIALDPDFAGNHYVYLDYTRKATARRGAHNEVIRVTARGNHVVRGSEKLLFRLDPQPGTHHVGGALEFGPGGMLFVTSGDSQRGPRAQRLTTLMGKILRIRPNGTIPRSNPFYRKAQGRNRAIWARGLRNPFKLSYDGARLFVNDVGEQTWEEIDDVRRGRNYGWPVKEGPETAAKYTPPVHAYRHGSTNRRGCAITGGTFYDPATSTFPAAMQGDYFFADLCSGWIRRYDLASGTSRAFATNLPTRQLVDLEVGRDGALLVLRLNGAVTRIQATT
jgi:glucose/arabinose dehydrogenase